VIKVVYTTDFVNVSTPQVFFSAGGGVIDSVFVTNFGGMNYLYYRDDATTSLRGARSSSLNPGSFTTYTGEIQAVSNCIEAPTLVRQLTDTSNWYLWGDNYCPNARFFVWRGDLASGVWSLLNDTTYTTPQAGKHNSIQSIDSTTYNGLLSRYGGQSWNRIKSWNFPNRYVVHASNQGRIDPIPYDPHQDMQWRIVPGLADPAGVSFESVSMPGRYLRHYFYNVVLAQNDNTAVFKADATFYRVAGLANSSWSSFRSYNFPDRYIRHFNYTLRIETNTGAAFAADATFRIVY
jgi:hypothetical protein